MGGQAWEAKWLLLNPGKTPTRSFLGRINDDVQALLPLARVTGAETYCGQYAGYKRWLKAKGFFSKINEPVDPEPPKTKPIPSADDKHNWLTDDHFFRANKKHGDKEILPNGGISWASVFMFRVSTRTSSPIGFISATGPAT